MSDQPQLYTLEEAAKILHDQLHDKLDEGTHCPTCEQFAKRYHRPITAAMAYGLVLVSREQMHRKPDNLWVHVENMLKNMPGIPSSIRGDFAKLVHWGLVERQWGMRNDGSTRNGYYRVTPLGFDWVHGRVTILSHVNLYNDTLEGLDGEEVTVKDVIKKQFDYNEIMHDMALVAEPQPTKPAELFDLTAVTKVPERARH